MENYIIIASEREVRMKQKNLIFWKDLAVVVLFLSAATIIANAFFTASDLTINVGITYALFVICIAHFTTGYFWGGLGAVIAVAEINFFFLDPVMEFNLSKKGYPFILVGLLVMSLLISTITVHLKESKRLLVESEKEKMRANLLRAISHDLRTPLTGIIGASRACLDNPDMDIEERQRLLHDIVEDSSWLLNMVENLLSITRIETGCTELKKDLEPLEEIISDSVFRIKKRYSQAEIHVEYPDEIVLVSVDSMLMVQVIMNLLENAIKYSQSTEPIVLKAELLQHKVRVSVRDYGVGIPPEKLKALFAGTYACKDINGDSKRGMGIGLSLCKTIIAAHGGEIEGKNHEKGAEIYFWLPLEGEEHESEDINFNY